MNNQNIFEMIEEVAMESGFAKDGITDRALQWIIRNVFRKNRSEDFIRSFIDDKTYKSYQLFNDKKHGYKSPSKIKATSAVFHYDPAVFNMLDKQVAKLINCLSTIYNNFNDSLSNNTKQALIQVAMLSSVYVTSYGEVDKIMRGEEPFNLTLFNEKMDEFIKSLNKTEYKCNSNEEVIKYLSSTKVMSSVANAMNAWYIWVLCDPNMAADIGLNRSDKDIDHTIEHAIQCTKIAGPRLEELLKKYNEFLNTMAEDIRKL